MNIRIRIANPSDLESVLSLAEDFTTSFEIDRGKFEVSFAAILDDPKSLHLVAESGAEVIGYCLGFWHDSFYANGRVAWLEEIMVAAEHRRSGVASQLMAHYEDWASENGAKISALATRRASEFYQDIGYEESASYFRKIL